jgi:hypothetical protein
MSVCLTLCLCVHYNRTKQLKEIGPWSERKTTVLFSKWVKEAGARIKGEDEAYLSHDAVAEEKAEEEEENEGNTAMETTTTHNDGDKNRDGDPTPSQEERVEVVPLRLLKRSNEEQMKKLFQLLRSLPEAIHYYLDHFIFPTHMENKVTKLSAAGTELGGEMLFPRRIGFSGTPSDLLPFELGKCGYEKGSDGEMITVLSSPDVCSYEVTDENWSPTSLLDRIAYAYANANPQMDPQTDPQMDQDQSQSQHQHQHQYHALIDTGALITGT